jgi:hypothetical protein
VNFAPYLREFFSAVGARVGAIAKILIGSNNQEETIIGQSFENANAMAIFADRNKGGCL